MRASRSLVLMGELKLLGSSSGIIPLWPTPVSFFSPCPEQGSGDPGRRPHCLPQLAQRLLDPGEPPSKVEQTVEWCRLADDTELTKARSESASGNTH